MSKRVKRVVAVAIVNLVAIGGYFGWGAWLEAEYERRVQALRDRGDYVDEPQSWTERVAPDDNVAVVLAEASDLLERLQKEDEELEWAVLNFAGGDWAESWHEPEDYVQLRKAWPKFDGYFAKLDEAISRPTFVPHPAGPEFDVPPWSGKQDAIDMLKLRVRLDPAAAPHAFTFLLELADKWKPDGDFEARVRFTVRSEALGILHRGLHEGTLDVAARRQVWDERLAHVEPIEELKDMLRFGRMGLIRPWAKLRRGEDPWAGVRETYAAAREQFRKAQEDGGLEQPREVPSLPEVPWFASWYGRPILHYHAVEVLNEMRLNIVHTTSEESLRAALVEDFTSGTPLGRGGRSRYMQTLEHIAVLRLARIAMAVQADAESRGEARERLDELGAEFDTDLLRDPFTGQPFLYERHGDHAVLSCSLVVPWEGERESVRSAMFKPLFFEELLVWEVRWEPAKKGD